MIAQIVKNISIEDFYLLGLTPCNPLEVSRCFGEICHLLLQGRRRASVLPTCFHTGFLLDLFLDPEDGSDMFL
jgi:hypothetical protein